jgi:hypothetical protein
MNPELIMADIVPLIGRQALLRGVISKLHPARSGSVTPKKELIRSDQGGPGKIRAKI